MKARHQSMLWCAIIFSWFVIGVSAFVHHPFSGNTLPSVSVAPAPRQSSNLCRRNALKEEDGADIDAAQKLLDKAAELRAEIAAMEGKTVEQVTLEAQQKKQEEADRKATVLRQQEEKQAQNGLTNTNKDEGRNFVQVPETFDDMVRQAARAVERAFQDGLTRQTVRFNLVQEDGQNAIEENQWPGGAQQMYREAAKPLTTALLREVRAPTKAANDATDTNLDDTTTAATVTPSPSRQIAPKIIEQDIWDFDGSALHTAEASEGPSGDIQALVFPNTDVKYIRDIDEISKTMGSRLFLLVNPFWRNIESWSFNLLAPNAKAKAQSIIFDNGYDETYVNLVFQVRGEKCVAIKAYPYDWQIFAMREVDDDYYNYQGIGEYAIRLGSSKEEPKSSLVTALLNERPEFKESKTMRQMKKIL